VVLVHRLIFSRLTALRQRRERRLAGRAPGA
jgi:hypothetical protein